MAHNSQGWRLDRTLSLPVLIALVSAIMACASLAATVQKRLETVESQSLTMNTELRETRVTALQVARIEARLDALHQAITALREEMRIHGNGSHPK